MASTTQQGTRQKWNKDSMTMAILAIKEKKMGYLKASKTFGVPKTTLIRLCQKKNMPLQELTNIKLGRKATLPTDLENDLAEYVLRMEEAGFGLTRRDIKSLAYQLAEKNNLTHTFSREKQSAGKTWLRLFLKRHPTLSFRQPTGTSIARLKGFNRENVNRFFELLEEAVDKYKYTPNNIYNVDETGITVVPSKMPEILAEKGKRQIKAATSGERGSTVTCVLCMNASGSFVPPMMIFPRKRDSPLLMRGAPPGSIHACHPSGWIQTDLFTQWFKHFLQHVKPSDTSPVLLILDGHASHTRNIELIDLARDNHVQLLSLPPHSSHKIQPLDRTFMGPLKKYFTEEIRQFVRNKGQNAQNCDIAELFGRAYIKAQRAELAIHGFRVTGICPVDKNVFQDHDFIDCDSEQSGNNQLEQVGPIQQSQVTVQLPPAISAHNSDDCDSDRTICESPSLLTHKSQTNEVQTLAKLALAASSKYSDRQSNDSSQEINLIPIPHSSLILHSSTDLDLVLQSQETNEPGKSYEDVFARPSTSTAYLSPKQICPIPSLRKKSSNRGRKASKSTVLTSSPYKLDLMTSIKRKNEAEALKNKKNAMKELKGKESKNDKCASKRKKSVPKKNNESDRKKAKETNKTKALKKVRRESTSSDESDFSINDMTDESPDRSQRDNGKCFYCNGLFSEDTQGEQWIQCPSCERWAHEECAGVDSGRFICEFCQED